MFALRIVRPLVGLALLFVAGCGGDASLPSDQQGLAEEIKTLRGTYFIDKKAPEKGIFSVNLSGTKIDDAFVAKLEVLPGLTHLKLNATPVTNAAAASLKNMKTLSTLDLGNTKITAEAVESIRAALPNCQISWNVTDATDAAAGGQPGY